jgi:hypothetical protein
VGLAAQLVVVSAAGRKAPLLPADARVGVGVLFRLQVTVASALGSDREREWEGMHRLQIGLDEV